MAWRDSTEPTVRDRPLGLVLCATASALASGAILVAAGELFLGAAGYSDWTRPKLVSNEFLNDVQVYPEHYLLMGAVLLVPAAYLLALGIGIWLRRAWAWIMGIVAGGLIACYGLLALVIPGSAQSSSGRWHVTDSLPWIALGVILLRYFDRRSVRNELGWGDPAIG